MMPGGGSNGERDKEGKHSGGSVIAVVSGKGGVGKTNVALNLGIQLARCKRRAILMDADFGLANADILLNVAPLADCTDLKDPRRSLDELLVEGPAGLRLLCGVSGLTRGGEDCTPGPAECRHALSRLRAACDVVIVDCGAGFNRTIRSFAVGSDLLMLVTTPEPTSLADSYATLKLLAGAGYAGPAGLVVNMARSQRESDAVAGRMMRAAAGFLGLRITYLGYVPTDRHVPLAVRARVPVKVRYPRCPASLCLDDICNRLLREVRLPGPAPGLWSRVAGLFL